VWESRRVHARAPTALVTLECTGCVGGSAFPADWTFSERTSSDFQLRDVKGEWQCEQSSMWNNLIEAHMLASFIDSTREPATCGLLIARRIQWFIPRNSLTRHHCCARRNNGLRKIDDTGITVYIVSRSHVSGMYLRPRRIAS